MAYLALTLPCVTEPEKLRSYLLDERHPKGGPKARFFIDSGFSAEDVEQFADALRGHAMTNEIDAVLPSPHGTKYRVRCHISTPNGRDPCVVTIWIDDLNRGRARLVTAYPS